ncbi:MAG: hypothetical protein V1894_02805 [Chloroflexota bacterium]
MRESKVRWLPLNCQEAQLLELSLRGGDPRVERYRKLLLQIGECLVSGQDTMLTVTEEDLWFLRDKLVPSVRIGETSGMDLTKKIYRLLLTIERERTDREFTGYFDVEVRDTQTTREENTRSGTGG